MPRSSKHKSSKHSSRDAREYSDSERDSSPKERRSKEDSTAKASKDSSSSEKRKLDSKDAKDMWGSENGYYYDEHGSSKRRKERNNDGVGHRWNGGEDEANEGSKRSKASGDSKSRRKDESTGVYGEGEEVKKSSGRVESKHRDSSRKESKEGGADKERKFKEGRSERLVDGEEQRSSKQMAENIDDNVPSDSQCAEPDSQVEKRMRKRRDASGEGGKYAEEVDDRRFSKDESSKDGRQKEKRRDEKYKDKHRDEVHKDSKHRHEKQKDDRPAKEHTGSRSDEKHVKEEKGVLDLRQKKRKPREGDEHDYDGDRNIESSRDRERNHDRERVSARERDNIPIRNHDYDREYDHDRDHDYERDCARDWEDDRDCERDRDHYREQEYERHRYHDREGSHVDDRSARYKDTVGKRRHIEDHDDSVDSKSRAVKARYSDTEKRTLISGRTESDIDRGRSRSRQTHLESTVSSILRRSPVSNSHVGKDEYRDFMTEQRTKVPREGLGFLGPAERGPKYKHVERPIKTDDSVMDIQTERSSGSKASPIGLKERSPSTSVDRRCMSRSSRRRSVEIEESGQRNNSIDPRDSNSEDRVNRDIPPEKPFLDDSTQADSSFYGRSGQGNTPVIQKTSFRNGLDRPSMGSLEDDGRDYSNARYRRSVDPGFGRVPGNSWRGVPNWTPPIPNNFVPFQHGPAHFQAMMPQFPSQPMFGVRPPMDVNHAGIPFHIPDADRFPGHMRPLAWQNIMDGTGPSHLHGWDSNNGMFRDAQHMYNNSEWERNRHLTSSQAWESGVETWKDESGDVKKDLSSPSSKLEYGSKPQPDEVVQMAHDEMENLDRLQQKVADTKPPFFTPPAKETSESVPTSRDKTPDSSSLSNFDNCRLSCYYLSKLDISAELTNPEVYDQCFALLIPKTSREDDDNDDRRVPVNRLKPSLFPLIDNSVFQRAMDLYKKQSAEVACVKSVNRIARDNISASDNEVEVKECPDPDLRNKQESAMVTDENISVCALHNDKVGPVSTAGGELRQDSTMIPSLDGGGSVHSSPKPAVQLVGTFTPEELEEPTPAPIGYSGEARASEQLLDSGDANGNWLSNSNATAAAITSSVSRSKARDNDLACGADEMKASGNGFSDPLFLEDGSSKTCESLMPESNESESVILTRIHRSSESTH